jgi:hypothetical protein
MSAALVVLPMVWAYAEVAPERSPERGPECGSFSRKGPHRLALVQAKAEPAAMAIEPKHRAPRMAFYRKYTEGMLQRYLKLSMEAGRAPSLLGRELFRGRVTSYRVRSFEDVVIYVHDVEKCMARLGKGQQLLVRRIALQEYTQAETAAMYGIALRTVIRRYHEAVDQLTRLFIETGLLTKQRLNTEYFEENAKNTSKFTCQEAEIVNFDSSVSF